LPLKIKEFIPKRNNAIPETRSLTQITLVDGFVVDEVVVAGHVCLEQGGGGAYNAQLQWYTTDVKFTSQLIVDV
jgi:hypothetical protein